MFTLKMYYTLLENKDSKRLYMPVADGNENRLFNIGDQHFAERPDRFQVSDITGPERFAVMGKSVNLGFGKTLEYPLILWVSNHNLIFLKQVEEIRYRYLVKHLPKIDPLDMSAYFFINTVGGCIVGEKKGLDWSDFSIVTGVGHVTSHVTRRMQSQFILESDDVLLEASRVHLLAHSKAVNRLHYRDKQKQRSQTAMAQATYSGYLSLVSDLITDMENYV